MTHVLGDAAPWLVRQVGSLTLTVASPLAAGGQSPWWPAVLAASIPLAGVVFVAIFNALAARDNADQLRKSTEALEGLRADLTEKQEEASAERDYRFEAKKRLYTELGPLVFSVGGTVGVRIVPRLGLAASARKGRLASGSGGNGKNRLKIDSAAISRQVLWFMAPLATYHLCQQRPRPRRPRLEHRGTRSSCSSSRVPTRPATSRSSRPTSRPRLAPVHLTVRYYPTIVSDATSVP